MAQQSAFDPKHIELQPQSSFFGLLEQFNLPPAFIAFLRRHQRAALAIVVGSILLALAIAGLTTYLDYRADQAAAVLDSALMAKENKRQLLEKVVQEYSSTTSGLWAKISLATLEEKEGQRAQAISHLEEINSGLSTRSPLKPLLLNKLAALYEAEHQMDKAVSTLVELAAREGYASEAYRTLGRVNEALGKKEEAAAMYAKYLELAGGKGGQEKNDPTRDMVQSRLNQLKK